MNPIIADADTGHGGLTATMKLAKMLGCCSGTQYKSYYNKGRPLGSLSIFPYWFL